MKINPHTSKAGLSSKHQETQREHNSVPFRNHILAIKTEILKGNKYRAVWECLAV